jgi:hypothetical protein
MSCARSAGHKSGTDTCKEPGLLCTDTRKSTRQCASVATTSIQPWTVYRHFSRLAHGPRQSSLVLFLERLGSSTVSAFSDLSVTSDQTCEAYLDAPSPLLPAIAIRGPEHTCWAYERAVREHPHRCIAHQLRLVPEHCPAKQAEVL